MQLGTLDDLLAFMAVARDQSFTKAAAKLAFTDMVAERFDAGVRDGEQSPRT